MVSSLEPKARLPGVTVVVPTHNRPLLLKRAVQSVLNQEYDGDVECIVVFDQSTVEELDIEERERRTIRPVPNQRAHGLAGARNSGVELASYDLVGFCDDDDLWLPNKLHLQVDLLRVNSNALLVGGGVRIDLGDRSFERRAPKPVLEFSNLIENRQMELDFVSALIRREAFSDVGLVNEDLPKSYAEDYEWMLRAARAGPVPMVEEPVVVKTWHPGPRMSEAWESVAAGNEMLLDLVPEFGESRQGLARVQGQIAFAYASLGERKSALRWTGRTFMTYPGEMRAVLALLVTLGIPSRTILQAVRRAGRGI